MKEIWAIVGGYDYEGYGAPEVAFATKEDAENYLEAHRSEFSHGYDEISVMRVPFGTHERIVP